MRECNNPVRFEDIELLAQNKIFEQFANKTVLISGASGLIGSELTLAFLCADRLKGYNTKVIALVRNIKKAKEVFSCVQNNPNLEFLVQDVKEPVKYADKIDYIIHTASLSASCDFVNKPVETILTIVEGTKNLLELAKEKKAAFLFLSSLEVYGILSSEKAVNEEYCGTIDPLNPRSSYAQAKRTAETLCAAYFAQYNVNTKIARLTQTFGAGIEYSDNRVFAQFAKSALNKTDIILHTKGETIRNYCYLSDAASALLTILACGEPGCAYNVANPDTSISVKDMAELYTKHYGINVKYDIDNAERGYNPTVRISLDAKRLENLGWSATVGLEEMIKKTVLYLKLQKGGENVDKV